jgi:hypothetical protein
MIKSKLMDALLKAVKALGAYMDLSNAKGPGTPEVEKTLGKEALDKCDETLKALKDCGAIDNVCHFHNMTANRDGRCRLCIAGEE